MGTFTKIKTLPLSIFNNAEYLAYLNSVLNLVSTAPDDDDDDRPIIESLNFNALANGAPAIGLSAEFLQTMENDLMLLADVVNESRISQETEEAAKHEANRDNLAIYITTRISRAGTLPLEAERDAGKYLYKVIKPYIGVARLPVAQETVAIRGLLIDLRKEENTPTSPPSDSMLTWPNLRKKMMPTTHSPLNVRRAARPTKWKVAQRYVNVSTSSTTTW